MTWQRLQRVLLVLSTAICYSYLATCYETISDATLQGLPDSGTDFDIHSGALLAPILQPRVPGTPGSLKVQQHFLDFFKLSLPEWTIELQNSTSKTPLSGGDEIPFVNIIASRDPPWAPVGEVGRLTLVAHYDSKLTPEGFIGAVDSAAPCAMILHAARSINDALTAKWAAMAAAGEDSVDLEAARGIQIIFTDGEEAFLSWTDTDSCYGARSLAETWEQTMHPAASTYHNALSSISLFVLLDLLGAAEPTIPSYFLTTHWAYKAMAKLESRLRENGKFRSSPNHSKRKSKGAGNKARADEPMFLYEADKQESAFRPSFVGDDHKPFMDRGVDILHLIPAPFPDTWHKIEDDGEHLDMDTVEDWATLITAFAAEWMELEGFLGSGDSQGSGAGATHAKRHDGANSDAVTGKSEL